MAKKIMFSDKFGLTEAVLSGRKTQTRRVILIDLYNACDWGEEIPMFEDGDGNWHPFYESKYVYKVGEVVAVAQSYCDFYDDVNDPRIFPSGAGWTNKMFVCADLMPHQIRITNVRVERLQDISDADCLAEGVEIVESFYQPANGNKQQVNYYRVPIYCKSGRVLMLTGDTPREAYAALIDRISGKGTWESNPWVLVYDFELVKTI